MAIVSNHSPTAAAAARTQTDPVAKLAGSGTTQVYVGTYTSGKSQGIYLLDLDLASGTLHPRGVAAEVGNPSFLAIAPNHRFLYSVNEGGAGGIKGGAVSAFAIDAATGHLTLLDQQSSGGEGPCHLSVDKTGKCVLVANYGSGSIAALPIHADGRLAPASATVQHHGSSADPSRQEGPHAHSINVDAADRFAFAADLGLDKILVYRFDAAQGTLVPNDPPAAVVAPKSGPRHFAFHPNGRSAYVINEIASTVTAFRYDPEKGTLALLQSLSTLPEGFTGNNSTAEIQVHPSGKFLYGSNRGHDSIAIFQINPESGRLTPAGHQATGGKTPRNFGIDPTGTFLIAANQDSDNLVVFRIDPETGRLTPTGHTATVPMPVCVLFLAGAR